MHNLFRSLRALTDVNWEDWLESVSLIETELRANAGYSALDFGTRNLYRSAIERIARGSSQDEIDVARAALARSRTAPDDLGGDVGYWLLDDGLAGVRALPGLPLSRSGALGVRLLPRAGLRGYVGVLTLLTAVLLALGAVVGRLPQRTGRASGRWRSCWRPRPDSGQRLWP